MILFPFMASAYDALIDGIYYNLVKKAKVAEVTYKYQGVTSPINDYFGDIVIPATIEYEGTVYNVEKISDFAFNESEITSISFPNSITSIGSRSFFGCKNLKSVKISDLAAWCGVSIGLYGPMTYANHLYLNEEEITELVVPNGVTLIANRAFSGCNAFTSIILPESLGSIGDGAFEGCSCVSVISIPNNVKTIGNEAFSECSSLSEINIGNGVESVGKEAFKNCTQLVSIELPNVTIIEEKLFSGCNSLKSVVLGDDVSAIGKSAFVKCSSLESINLGNRLLSIGESAFASCSSLTTIIIPESVNSIGFGTFMGCVGLSSIKMGNGVTSIGKQAFDSCSNLESIFLGKSIMSFGDYAFRGCNKLKEVHIEDLEAWCKIKTFNYNNNPLSYAQHLFLDDEEVFKLVIPQSITEIRQYTFSGCKYLTSVEIHDKVTRIEHNAFYGCTNLSAVHISDLSAWCNVTFVNTSFPLSYASNPLKYAHHLFINDEEITELKIPDNVEYIRDRVFYGCDGIKTLNLNNAKYIGSECFYECCGLEETLISDSVRLIYSDAFYGCKSLATIKIKNSATVINSQAFANCKNLLDVYCFGESIPYTASDIFKDSDISYANLHVPSTLTNEYSSIYPWSEFGNIIALTDTELSVSNIDYEKVNPWIYTLNGYKIPRQQKGLNIIYLGKGKSYKTFKSCIP